MLLTLGGGKPTAATTELAALSKALGQVAPSDERGRQHLLSSMCVALGSAKAAAAAEYVLELLSSSCERLLFFAHHRSMLDAVDGAVTARGVRTLRIDGSVPAVERAALVHTFQTLPAGTPAVFILSIQAAGQGLTLTAASTAVFGELRWVVRGPDLNPAPLSRSER